MATQHRKIMKNIEIHAPVERVFSFLTEPNNLPEIWPSMVEVSDVKREANGAHSFDFVYKMAGFRFNGHSDSTEVEPNKRLIVKARGGVPSTFEYLYESVGGNTRLTLNVEYTIPGQLLSRLAEPLVHRINEHEADVFLRNLKARMEMGMATGEEARAPVQ